MLKLTFITASLVLLIPLTTALKVNAEEQSHVNYDYVAVISSIPITRIEEHSIPYQYCWTEQLPIYDPYQKNHTGDSYTDALFGSNSYTGTILGGLVGGGIGNAPGHHQSNKKAGAIAGGLLGGAIGYDLTHNRRSRPAYKISQFENQHNCRTRYDTVEEEKVVGYSVRYRYNGNIYSTRTKNDPGDTLRLKIVATPIGNY